jgi:hypothetical protein
MMTDTRADTVIRAHAACVGMTDLERIALGASVVQTVIDPGYHQAVRLASVRLREHADALMQAECDLFHRQHPDGSAQGKATTHEQTSPSEIPVLLMHGAPTPRAWQVSPWWRAAWDRFRTAEAAFSGSIWGDALAGICAFVIFLGALFAPLFIPV